MEETKPKGNLAFIKEFFGLSLVEMKNEMTKLTEKDKVELGEGIRNGSLTY